MTRAASTSPLVLVVFLVTMGNVAGRVAADLGIPGKSWPTKRTTDTEFAALAESEPNLQRATFGAGCYWGTEKYFADNMETKCPGCVRATSVGFMGPTQPKEGEYPTYNEVCTGRTGHVEVVQIVYDKSVCTLRATQRAPLHLPRSDHEEPPRERSRPAVRQRGVRPRRGAETHRGEGQG